MNIVLLTGTLSCGGAERVATTLANAWTARGDTVTLVPTFSGGGTPFYPISPSVEVIYLTDLVGLQQKNFSGYTRRIFALRNLIKDKNPDVLISFLPNVNVASILASAFLEIPTIICERTDPSHAPRSMVWNFACQVSYPFATLLTVQTNIVATTIHSIYKNLKMVRSIPNPIPLGVVETKIHTGPSVRKEKRILLSLGRLAHEKRLDNLVSAFSDISQKTDEWDLHIYGDGPLRGSIASKIKELGLEDRIHLKGNTTDPWKVMSESDAFIMTSEYEGFPNALLEAMGVGLPCIATDCPSGPREISRDGKDALLVPLGDLDALKQAIEQVMGDEAFRAELGDRARRSVLERFQLSTVLHKWDVFFKEVGIPVSKPKASI